MKKPYLNKKRMLKRVPALFRLMDDNENGSVSLNEFFQIIDHIQKNSKFSIPSIPNIKP